MRILQLTVDYPPPLRGGLPRQVQGLARALAAAGHEVGVVTMGSDRLDGAVAVHGTEAADARLPSVGLEGLPAANFALCAALMKAVASSSWDVVHAHDWMVTPAVVTVRHAFDLPVVATFHADAGASVVGTTEDRRRRLEWERALVDVAAQTLACGPGLARTMQERHPDRSIVHVPNGFDIEQFGDERADVVRLPTRVLFVGRLVSYKGCQDVIEAVAMLAREWPDIELRIVGDGYARPDLEEMVDARGVRANVTFVGWLEDDRLATEYRRAAMLVMPSHEEAFGLVALEAMAAGTPVITTPTGIFAEIVDEGRTVLVVPPGDPAVLAQRVDRLLREPALRQEMAQLANQHVLPHFTWERVVTETVRTYEGVLNVPD